jgi:3-hydroxyisobutyrate dehydrogenase-like beta-hydroxyacid dehydrogenase
MNIKELTIAHIGLGRMGAGIANNIQAAGCHSVVYNRSTEKMQPFVAAAARTPREGALEADIVVTSLMDDKSVFDVISGDDGILAGIRGGAIHIGTSTISPGASTRCSGLHAVQGSHYLSAPVLGRPDAAAAGKLFTFVAGKSEIIDRSRPVLECYAQNIIVLGEDPASAASLKLAAIFFGASLLEVIGEAFTFAEKRGVLEPLANMLKGFLPPMAEYLEASPRESMISRASHLRPASRTCD